MKRICKKCGDLIGRKDRRQLFRWRVWGFLWVREAWQHINCDNPHQGPSKRLPGEVTPPFPVTTTYTYFNSETGQESQPTPAQELARID
jgi:hypothetical protein